MDLDAQNIFPDNPAGDVYIDSVFEVTNIVPDVGVKVEVNENDCHSLPFLQDPATVTSQLSGYINPLVPETDVVVGCGSTVDPIRVEVQKDLFARGTLGSTHKPIEVDHSSQQNNFAEVINIDQNDDLTHNIIIPEGEDHPELCLEAEEIPTPVEIIPIEDEEPVVQISSVPFNKKANTTVSTTAMNETNTSQTVSYITFSNDNQLVIRPLARAQEQGSSYVLDEKEIKNISKEINKQPWKKKRKIVDDNVDTKKVEKKKVVKKKASEKETSKKKSKVNQDFSKWGGRVSKEQLHAMMQEKEKHESDSKQNERKDMVQRNTRSRRSSTKPVNYCEENLESIDKYLSRECVTVNVSFAASNNEINSTTAESENYNNDNDDYNYGVDDDDDDSYYPEIGTNNSLDYIDSIMEEKSLLSDTKEANSKVRKYQNKDKLQENSATKTVVKLESEPYVLLEVIKVEQNTESYNIPESIGAISNAAIGNENNPFTRKRGRSKRTDNNDVEKSVTLGDSGNRKKEVSGRKSSEARVNQGKSKNTVVKTRARNNGKKYTENDNKGNIKLRGKNKKLSCSIKKSNTGRRKKSLESGVDNEINDNTEGSTVPKKAKRKCTRNKINEDGNVEEGLTLDYEDGIETGDTVPSGEDTEDNEEFKPKKKKPVKTNKKKGTRRPANKKDWPCSTCNEIFPKQSDLRDHKLEYHSAGKKVVCEHCNETFFKGSSFTNHMEKVHGIAKEYECLCKEKFKVHRHLKVHKRSCNIYHNLSDNRVLFSTDEKSKDRTHMCDLCGMTFYLKGSLVNHERYFHSEPALQCPFCPKKVKTKTSLLYHVYAHKEVQDTDEIYVECTSVEKTKTETNLTVKEDVSSPSEVIINENDSVHENVISSDKNTNNLHDESVLSPVRNTTLSLIESVSPVENTNQPMAESVLSPVTNINQTLPESILSPITNTDQSRPNSTFPIASPLVEECTNVTNPVLTGTDQTVLNTFSSEILDPVTNAQLFAPYFENTNEALPSEDDLSNHKSEINPVTVQEKEVVLNSDQNAKKEENESLYNCPLCNFTSKVDGQMKGHILSDHAMKSRKPFPPSSKDDSDDPFSQYKPRNRYFPVKSKYIPKHYKSNEFLCSICGQGHSSRTSLSDHIAAAHTKAITRKCEVCGKGFMTYYAHMRHRRVVHGVYKDPHKKRENTVYRICTVCGQKVSKGGYGKHLDMHNGVYRFNCEVCSKACRSKHDLMVHSRIHTGEKPYSCNICDRKFSDLANLRHHEKRVHKVNKATYTLPKQREEIDDFQREIMQIRTRRLHIPMEYE